MAQIVQHFTHPGQHRIARPTVAVDRDPTRAFVWRGVLAFTVLFWGGVIYMVAA